MKEKFLKSHLSQWLAASLIVCLVVVGCAYALYQSNKEHTQLMEAEKASNAVYSLQQLLKFEFESMVADVRLLSKMQESQQVFTNRLTAPLAKNLLFFTLDKKAYDNIRYLDRRGMELFRVDYLEGSPAVATKHDLQDKGNTYYFKGSEKLKVGEVYISALDLDTEPYATNQLPKPIIRIAAPLFALDGTRHGVVILNYFGNHICRIMELGSEESGENPMLLNDKGYWLRSDNADEEWGFLRKEGTDLTFQSRFPKEWEHVTQTENGQTRTPNGLFTFATIDPGQFISELTNIRVTSDAGKWVIMIHTPMKKLTDPPKAYLASLSTVLIPLAILIMASLYFICLFRQTNKQAQLDIIAQQASYARFVPKEFLALLGKGRYRDLALESHADHQMCVLFSDIRSYTKLSEGMSHLEVIQFLNEYFRAVNGPIVNNEGFVDSFHGDALLALFKDGNAEGAVRAAIAMQHSIKQFNEERAEKGEKTVAAGIGLHCGEVTLGALGTNERLQATVIGDVVNLAARIESCTKTFGVSIVISDSVFKKIPQPEIFNLREIDTVRVKGKQTPVALYEVFDADREELIAQKQSMLSDFSQALTLYRKGDFENASAIFDQCMKICPEDTISPIFFKRCKTMMRIPPGDGWTGISTL
nr:adenylate/guanylate cyclase domain-containing protein [uncultured Pseudodesulfovibrio sp.]